MSLLELIIEGAFAVGGVELVTTVLDTVLVSADEAVSYTHLTLPTTPYV